MLLAELSSPPYLLTAPDLAGIQLSCMVIAGTLSHPSLRTIAAVVARNLPHSRFVELDGSGHVTYFERPDQFARNVAAFATDLNERADAGHDSRRSIR
ncbi:alpha/beta fold hydrolase [Nocardia sp. NPDC020380]|uniref:alpha/beta fold hydrolase n=1 Tax=Nocardia sp. NPDC020380 TaxID=3364309 RepID=UPI0037B833BD